MANADAPTTAKGRATRERILQAAAELVAEKGAAGMSLVDVRARTGASRSQLYHYFEVVAVLEVVVELAAAGARARADVVEAHAGGALFGHQLGCGLEDP